MTDFVLNLLNNSWSLTAEMAPYLLLGFAAAGFLHVLVRPSFIERHLGSPGLASVIKASLFGVPVPLCSCSVIPLAASLRKSGASRGATASFLSSTPQTGIDSILATIALLGGVFATVRLVVAFACGILTGFLIELFCKEKAPPAPDFAGQTFTPIAGHAPAPASAMSCCRSQPRDHSRNWRSGLRYCCITLPADLAKALIIGLLLAGLITSFLPENLLSGTYSSGIMAFVLATVISLPLYVCATGSIPMAYALIAAGMSPGAALVFLIMGPATNTATIVTAWKMLGRAPTLIYLGSLLVISWSVGLALNSYLFSELQLVAESAHDGHRHLHLWQHLSAGLLAALLLFGLVSSRRTDKADGCCA